MRAKHTGPIKQELFQPVHTETLLLVDRDGTLNFDKGYTHKSEDLKVKWDVADQLKNLIFKDTAVVCITNQSGIGRGYFQIHEVFDFNNLLAQELSKIEFKICAFYICPHSPEEECECRKPKTQMIRTVFETYKVSPEKATFVGNSESDCTASHMSGIHYISAIDESLAEKVLQRKWELRANQ